MSNLDSHTLATLASAIKTKGLSLGFQDIRICEADPGKHAQHLQHWLDHERHGTMDYMQRHADLRKQPSKLQNNAIRVISCRYDYLPDSYPATILLNEHHKAYISRYALGRDYHKLLRKKLSQLCHYLESHSDFKSHRAFVDSAPILERAFAEKSGLGWIAKNTMLINAQAGSWFFLAEILTDAPLPIDSPQDTAHCGTCTSCLDICPTNAFNGPWELDARKCISYLTIENKGSIPKHFRPMMGNRVFGCDDCQLVCPWNKFAQLTQEGDFQARHNLDNRELSDLFNWDEHQFLGNTAGSAIRRIGYIGWLRNLSVAMGNAPYMPTILNSLLNKTTKNDMLREHIDWAIAQQTHKRDALIASG